MSDVVTVGGGTQVPIPELDPFAGPVDKGFFRYRYDAGVVVPRVTEELRGSVNLDEATARAEVVMPEVLNPTTVEIGLTDGP